MPKPDVINTLEQQVEVNIEGLISDNSLRRDVPSFELPPDHPIALQYQPTNIGKGSEHLVYSIEGHPNIVVKANTNVMRKIIRWNAEDNRPLELWG